MRKIKAAIFGTGFMGKVHTEAIRRLGNVEVVAVAASSQATADRFAETLLIPKATGDWKSLVEDPAIDAVHICTPNSLHFPMSKAALESNKHVLCEKPLSMNLAQAHALAELAAEGNLAHCVNHNLRCYPMVQQVRAMIAAGELGEILVVNGTYFQDWLLFDTDWNWRADSAANGALRAMGDIGSHWMDAIENLTGLRITSLCADLATFHEIRRRPKGSVETFTGKKLAPENYIETPVSTDDFGAVLLRLNGHSKREARGSFAVSQVAAGRKNRFNLEIYGTKSGVAWNQERPDELWIGHRNSANQLILKDPSLLHPSAAAFADLPGGHSEGYDDTHKQMFRRFYARVADKTATVEYPTFADGARGMQLLEKVHESSQDRAWVDVSS
jgi:predicted dehydrogenase